MLTNQQYSIALLLFFGLCFSPNATRAQEGADKLVVHIRSAAVTLNHVSLKNELLAREVAASLEKVDGVTRTRALPLSSMVEARFDTNKTTGAQIAEAAKKVLEARMAGRKIEAENVPSHKASSKILVMSLGDNRVQLTSERFY
jgi:copper chaperone CopZ